MKTIDKGHIIRNLREFGIKDGDTVLVHSSLSGIGNVEGGADSVIDAFLDVIGNSGTLVMPVFTDNLADPFDVLATPSDVGIITEVFRKRQNVLRSLHPTHSVCAAGRHAAYIINDHDLSPSACGRNSPFYKILELKGKIVLLGVDMNRNTMLHAIEEEAGVPYLIEKIILPAPAYIVDYLCKTVEIEKFPSGHRDFLKLSPALRFAKLMNEAYIGTATVKVFEVEKLFKFVIDILKDNPGYFLCKNEYCNSCIAAWGKINGSNNDSPKTNNRCNTENCEICCV